MNRFLPAALLLACIIVPAATGQSFEGDMVTIPGGTYTMGEAESAYQGPPGSYDATLHEVTLSDFQMSETEVNNQQYVDFLNAALAAGLVEVAVETRTPLDLGNTLVYGSATAPEAYRGEALLNLDGTRVMKDHNDSDGDDDPFTGVIEPENPLNLTYIGYDESRTPGTWFYVKDPRNADDFDWATLTTYYNYTSVSREEDTSSELNDYDDWEELAGYPNNLPTQIEVQEWPATFIRWYGAKAFALFYGLALPTEAQWEYASQGGEGFAFATADGQIAGDGSSANWNHLEANPSRGHVLDVRRGEPNPYGLYNMAGNVWEWTEDWYDASFYADATEPVNTLDTGLRVRRGGSWNYHRSTLKSAARARDEPFKGNDHFGFRVVGEASSGVASETRWMPTDFELAPAFPNPFYSSTVLSVVLPSASGVRIEIFDALGRQVALPLDGRLSAGRHEIVWEAQGVPGGVYFAKVSVDASTQTRSLILAR